MASDTSGPDERTERLRLPAVIALLFLFSWPGVLPQVLASWLGPGHLPRWVKALQFLILAPGLVALAAAAVNGGRAGAISLLKRLLKWRAPAGLYAGVLLGPPLVLGGSAMLAHALGLSDIALDPGRAFAKFAPTFLVYLLLNNEELAWRGYVLPRMQARRSPLQASLVLGLIWTVFHAPYFFMKGGHPGGMSPVFFVLAVPALTILLTRTFNSSGGSVLLPHLLHQSINGWAEALPVLPPFAGGSPWPSRFALVAVLALAGVAAVREHRRELGPARAA